MTVYSTDTFDRTNSTTNLGSTDGAGTVDPIAWVQDIGTWGISSNQAYTSTGANPALAHVDLAQADVVLSITAATIESGTSAGLIFRYTDNSNYWRATQTGAGNLQLFKVVATVATQIGGNITGGANGDILSVVARSSVVKAYRNGVLQLSTTDAHNSTATKHGLWIANTSVNNRLNNWAAASVFVNVQSASVTQTQTLTLTPVSAFLMAMSATQIQTPTIIRPGTIAKTLTATQVQV